MKNAIFTVEINNERLVIGTESTQHKNRVSSWWCCGSRNGGCCHFRNWCWYKTIIIAAGTSSQTIFLNFFSYCSWKFLEKYLTGAVELPGFESCQTIIFALIVIFAVVNTSTKRQTVIVNTSVPVLVFFYNLYRYWIYRYIQFTQLY